MLPVAAVGRTAVAVGDIADCGIARWMTRGRVWIGVLGILLGGIVALNVWGLSLSAASSDTAAKIDVLQRDNSVLRARVASRLSDDQVEAAAAKLGFAIPAPDEVRYLKVDDDGDAAAAAKRLAAGEVSLVADALSEPETTDPAIDPATGLPIDPATGMPIDPAVTAATDPAAVDATGAEPATAIPTDPATGAVAAP